MNHCLNLYIFNDVFCLSWINPFFYFLFSVFYFLFYFICCCFCVLIIHILQLLFGSIHLHVAQRKYYLFLFIHFGFLFFFCVRSSNFVNSTSNCKYMLMNMCVNMFMYVKVSIYL